MRDPRLTLEDQGLTPLGAYAWPFTCRFTTSAPWGFTQQELTLNVPALSGKHAQTRVFAVLLWSLAIAPAISRSCQLELVELMVWGQQLVPEVLPGAGAKGQRFAGAADRDQSGQIVMMTGHSDASTRRRLFLPGIPRDWVADGLLTHDGWEGMMVHSRAIYMGLSPIPPDVQADWLIAYSDRTPADTTNPYGVGFRAVSGLRVCHHTDRAPDLSLGLWP